MTTSGSICVPAAGHELSSGRLDLNQRPFGPSGQATRVYASLRISDVLVVGAGDSRDCGSHDSASQGRMSFVLGER
jgi:hypothetical protein